MGGMYVQDYQKMSPRECSVMARAQGESGGGWNIFHILFRELVKLASVYQ
mgnify:CR=1 FL=1